MHQTDVGSAFPAQLTHYIMITWWQSLSTLMQVLWAVTLSASLIFIIETVLTFLGLGDADLDVDSGADADFGGDGHFDADPSMNLLTFRNFVNFCLGFGWTAVLLADSISSKAVLLLVSVLVGVLLVGLVMWMFKWLSSMQQSGNIDIHKSAAGCEGTVYLTVPAERKGTGKVQITINNAVREYDAITDGDEIRTGTPIKVIEATNEYALLVEPTTPTII